MAGKEQMKKLRAAGSTSKITFENYNVRAGRSLQSLQGAVLASIQAFYKDRVEHAIEAAVAIIKADGF
eukprot:7624329-Alexandrium_andersonii.AAC.1